ncbi:MAG: hypothetical protein EOP11_10935, partial [Proteobacteria bacterium]
ADFSTIDEAQLIKLGMPPGLKLTEGARAHVSKIAPFKEFQEPVDASGDLRAGLIIAHGAAKLFYPYFRKNGRGLLDERLLETLRHANQNSRADMRHSLRRLGEALSDGHHFVFDRSFKIFPDGGGLSPIAFENVNGAPVVAASAVTGAKPGDQLVAVDGEPIEIWLPRELGRSGGATPGYRFDLAMRELQIVTGARRLTFEGLDGNIKQVITSPETLEEYTKLKRFEFTRPSGWVEKNVYYINTGAAALPNLAGFEEHLTEAARASSLILDLRESPGVSAVEIAKKLICGKFYGPQITTPVLTGPGSRSTYREPRAEYFGDGTFSGNVTILVGPATVSAGEHFATILVDAKRVTVVGRRSAGTNGSLTGLQLPGKFFFSFTGMKVRHASGEPFHGVGILPDYYVAPTAADYAAGRDAVLLEAIRLGKASSGAEAN